MFSGKVEILSNQKLSKDYYLLEFHCPVIAQNAVAGQFVQIRVEDNITPLLRRPFSIFGVQYGKIQILYKVVGQGTEILKKRKVGERIEVIGPLGKGFELFRNTKQAILVGGGIGIAPLAFLANTLKDKEVEIILFYGARTSEELIAVKYLQKFDPQISTDDGTACFAGCITDLLQIYLQGNPQKDYQIYSCGPAPMMEAVYFLAKDYSISCQLSLEERMACGIGACLGCVVETKEGYKRVCVEGPVFEAKELIF